MFDVGFTEILLIGVVSLVVIGPERLPDVARTAGKWIGKMQRFVRGVKTDIANELDSGELKKLIGDQKTQIDELRKVIGSTTRDLESSTRDVVRGARKKLTELEDAAARADAGEADADAEIERPGDAPAIGAPRDAPDTPPVPPSPTPSSASPSVPSASSPPAAATEAASVPATPAEGSAAAAARTIGGRAAKRTDESSYPSSPAPSPKPSDDTASALDLDRVSGTPDGVSGTTSSPATTSDDDLRQSGSGT